VTSTAEDPHVFVTSTPEDPQTTVSSCHVTLCGVGLCTALPDGSLRGARLGCAILPSRDRPCTHCPSSATEHLRRRERRTPSEQHAGTQELGTNMPCDVWGVERYDECAQHTVPQILHTGSRPALSRMHTMHAHMNSHTDCRVTTRALFSCSTFTPLHPLHRMEAAFRTWGTCRAF
jgi:hypothetical protein